MLERHPGLRVELIGQNSSAVAEELRRGRLEAAMISLPIADEGMTVPRSPARSSSTSARTPHLTAP